VIQGFDAPYLLGVAMAFKGIGFPSVLNVHSFSTPMISPDIWAMKLA
jgi:hypothetical protein